MRDIGAILWVVLVIIGVVSSIVSNARKQMAASTVSRRAPPVSQPPPQTSQRPVTPVRQPVATPSAQPRRVAVRQPPSPAPAGHSDVLQAHERAQPRARRLASLFGDRRSLVRAVIAAEVLGKPLALRDGD